MANIFAPFGFAESHRLGAAPNYQMGAAKRWILSTNANPIYFGDPVVQLASGYVAQATPSGSASSIAGIFLGCEYVSKAAKKIIWSPWWPGVPSDVVTAPAGSQNAGFDVSAKVVDDPATVFRVQANGQLTVGMIGMNATFTFGLASATAPGTNPAPNQVSGFSNCALDLSVVSAPVVTALPFRILDFIREPPGVSGTDFTTPYGWVFVTFNNQDFKVTTGI
jgi:hypothetical protein